MEQIYLHIFSIFAEKKTTQVDTKHEDKKTRKETVINQTNKLYFALCFTVTDRIHTYHTARPDTQYKVG